MAIVNFKINDSLDEKIEDVIKNIGFMSKAEFFRAAALDYINKFDFRTRDEKEFDYLTAKLGSLMEKKFAGKKLPSLKKQLGLA